MPAAIPQIHLVHHRWFFQVNSLLLCDCVPSTICAVAANVCTPEFSVNGPLAPVIPARAEFAPPGAAIKKFFFPSLDIFIPRVQPEIVAALPLESGH
jgi:hypothetical protein